MRFQNSITPVTKHILLNPGLILFYTLNTRIRNDTMLFFRGTYRRVFTFYKLHSIYVVQIIYPDDRLVRTGKMAAKSEGKQTRQPMYVWRNTEKHERHHCYLGRAMSITHFRACVCLRNPVCTTLPYCHLRPLWLHHVFRHYLINGTIFGKKLLNIKCVFWIPLQLYLKHFSF